MTATSTAAALAVVSEQLDGELSTLVDAIARGEYAFWLGSGISRDRVPDLPTMIRDAIAFLQRQRAVDANPARFEDAIQAILDLARLSAADRSVINIDDPISGWPGLDELLDKLSASYSDLFARHVLGEAPDYLLWNAVDVRNAYARDDLRPDCEHFCLAILAIEGVVTEMVSANWDGLVEGAVDEIGGAASAQVLKSIVCLSDLRTGPTRSNLYKIHGCAVRAKNDPATFREYLVVTEAQIAAWEVNSGAMDTRVTDLATTRKTLMIGLSARDSNIRRIFAKGTVRRHYNWPLDPPACIIAGPDIGPAQRAILQNAYGQAIFAQFENEITERSLLEGFAKPVLLAITLHVLSSKVAALAENLLSATLPPHEVSIVRLALESLRKFVITNSPADLLGFVREIVRATERVNAFYYGFGLATSAVYIPITTSPISQMVADPQVSALRLPEFAVALGLVAYLVDSGAWTVVGVSHDARAGSLTIESAGDRYRIFFVSDETAVVRLTEDARITSSDTDAILVYASDIPARKVRSPRSRLARTGRSGLRSASVRDVLASGRTVSSLARRLRELIAV